MLQNPSVLERLALAAQEDWKERHKIAATTTKSERMVNAEKEWTKVIQACHGPTVSEYLPSEMTLRAFWDGAAKCADPLDRKSGGQPALFAGEWCNGLWHDYAASAYTSTRGQAKLFVEAARCALHLEFPLQPQNPQMTATLLSQQQKPTWKPKRVIIVALALGAKGLKQACRLVATAYPRGWDVVLVKGPFRGLKYKFSDALLALKSALTRPGSPLANETLVLFSDGSDVLVQKSPHALVDTFLRNYHQEFVFSGEYLCFPMGIFPYSIGMPHHVCGDLYPTASLDTGVYPGQRMYVNTGGWIGFGNSAVVVLKELVGKEQRHRDRDGHCHDWGTDQLLGNIAYLQSPNIGLDADSLLFASDAWGLIDTSLILGPMAGPLTDDSKGQGYCTSNGMCPALLHFNGRSNSGGTLDQAFQQLTLDSKCTPGTLSIIDNMSWTMKTLNRSEILSSPIAECLQGTGCSKSLSDLI